MKSDDRQEDGRRSRVIRVGLQRENYPERRNISGSLSGANYVSTHRQNRWIRRTQREFGRLIGRSTSPVDQEFTFRPGRSSEVDLFHVFNSIVAGASRDGGRAENSETPWVTTFETVVPRFESTRHCHHGPSPDLSRLPDDAQVRKAVARLASPSCVALLALSECSLRMQEELLRGFPEQEATIRTKLSHLAPPQETLIDRIDEKHWDLTDTIRFVFVGAAFFRKGGREVLRVLERFRETDPRIHLTVVSTLRPDDYVGRIERAEIQATASRLERLSSWIDYVPRMPNDEVLALLRRSHVGLLPTYADTYGYAVLEFQAAGCPVISTDVRALPEINDPECGWIIEVPRNRLGEALYTTEADRNSLSRRIEAGLEGVLRTILSNPESIRLKGEKSLERVRRDHDPRRHGAELTRIYERAVSR